MQAMSRVDDQINITFRCKSLDIAPSGSGIRSVIENDVLNRLFPQSPLEQAISRYAPEFRAKPQPGCTHVTPILI